MDRRDFLKTTSAAAATATITTTAVAAPAGPQAGLAAPALSRGLTELRLAMPWPDGSASFGDSACRLARRIEAATAGRFRFDIVAAPNGGLEAVMLGEADLYHGSENHHLSFKPGLAYFAGLPYFCGLEPHDHIAWLTVGGGQALWDDTAAEVGIKPLLAGHSGRAPGLWSTREINSVADLEGQPIYIQGLARDVVKAFGADPVLLPAAHIADGLADGRLLAAEWGNMLASVSLGIPGVARHHIGLGINNAGFALTLGVRHTLWERLDTADRAMLEACAAEECRLALAEARAHETVLRDMLREDITHNLDGGTISQPGVKFDSMPGNLMAALSEAADDVVASHGDRDAGTRRVHDSYMAFRKAVAGLEPVRKRELGAATS